PLARFSDHAFNLTVTPDGSTAYVFDAVAYNVRKLVRFGGVIWGTPSSADIGTNSVELAARDAEIGVQNFDIIVGAGNSAPTATNQSVELFENSLANITLTATDVDGDPLTYTVTQSPANGTLIGTAPNVTYQPNTNFVGSDSFTFIVNDGHTDSQPATVSLTIDYRAPLVLTIARNANQVNLSWSSGYATAILESTTALGPSAQWTQISTAGTNATVTIGNVGRYFRLRVP
ncbi:MAG: putative Ig protein, partial [Verrucomicrobiales bacterium]|nr:putative Ig protein [Verrucomicrobiales bacterium]